jgi:hypothetical protein
MQSVEVKRSRVKHLQWFFALKSLKLWFSLHFGYESNKKSDFSKQSLQFQKKTLGNYPYTFSIG